MSGDAQGLVAAQLDRMAAHGGATADELSWLADVVREGRWDRLTPPETPPPTGNGG